MHDDISGLLDLSYLAELHSVAKTDTEVIGGGISAQITRGHTWQDEENNERPSHDQRDQQGGSPSQRKSHPAVSSWIARFFRGDGSPPRCMPHLHQYESDDRNHHEGCKREQENAVYRQYGSR